MVICNRCGAKLPDGTVFCGNCGAQLNAAQPTGDGASPVRYRRSAAAQNQGQNTQPQAPQGQWGQYQQPQQSPYQRPQQQPQQNSYQRPQQYQQPQQPQQGQWGQPQQGQWGQPQQGQWGQPPQGQWGQNPPSQNGQRGQKAMASVSAFFKKMMDNKGPADKKLLRITSLVFAIALAFFIIGIGGDIYIGRVATHGEDSLSGSEKSMMKQLVSATLRGDARGVVNVSGDLGDLFGGDSDEFKSEMLQSTKKNLREIASKSHKEYGLLWTMATFASHYVFLMIFFGIIAALAAGFWFWKGGRFNNIKETIWMPWAAIALGVGVVFFFHFCTMYSGITMYFFN